jgi:hypothetical protein
LIAISKKRVEGAPDIDERDLFAVVDSKVGIIEWLGEPGGLLGDMFNEIDAEALTM